MIPRALKPSQAKKFFPNAAHNNSKNKRNYAVCFSTAKWVIPSSNPESHLPKSKALPEYLLQNGILKIEEIYEPKSLNYEEIKRVHDHSFVERFVSGTLSEKEMRKIGLPYANYDQVVQRVLHVCGGTLDASNAIYENNLNCAAVLAGGAHHSYYDYGSGYCVFNDIVIAGESLVARKLINSYLVIDLDVHQGDGTASMLRHNQHAYTVSMHCQSNFPLVKQQSSWDIPLEVDTGDEEYLSKLQHVLDTLKTRRNELLTYDFVIYQAGVDVLKGDGFGRLALTLDGTRQRDNMVFQFCKEQGVPVVVTMGGGYPNKRSGHDIHKVVSAHAGTISQMKHVLKC